MNPSEHPVGPHRRAQILPPATRFVRLFATFSAVLLALGSPVFAQEGGTGSIEGRVLNAVSGDSLNNARVAVKGTNLVTLTDEAGYYRLTGVPAGESTLRVFFTGLDEQEAPVTVAAGSTLMADFKLTRGVRHSKDSETIVLDKYVIETTRETDAAAIAVNEQRMSRTQKSVISADQFGTIVDSNPGELLKWLPGVSVEYFANNIVGVSVRGLDAVNTAITFDGMPIASASTTTGDRNFEVLGASAADIARVEVRKLRTPEDSANALGGSLNLVRRSAFEASKRRLTYNLTFATDYEDFTFSDRPGIRDSLQQGWRPNWKLTWTDPVSKTFGYAITLARSDTLARVHWSAPSWNFGNAAQAAAAEALMAAGTPLTTVSVYNPARTQDLLHDNAKQDITDSASIKLDWRPIPELKISYSLAGSRYLERTGDDLRFTWNTGTPLTVGSTFTNGTLGNGAIQYDMREAWRNGTKEVLTHTIDAEWRRGDWTVNARASYSGSKHKYRDTEDGFFQSTTFVGSSIPNTGIGAGKANPRRITVNLSDRDFNFSQTIQAFDFATGAPLDWTDLNNMYIGGAVSRPGNIEETVGAVRLGVKHDFRSRNPFSIKLGFDFDETYRNRVRYDANLWRFVGADHVAGTPDDNAKQIEQVNVAPSRDTSYNSPAVPRISLSRLYDLYVAHPDWFLRNDAESYRFSVRDPYELDEKTYGGYLQATGNFFANRLSYIVGVRYERSEARGIGLLDRGSTVIPAGVSASSLQAAQLRYVRKGASAEGSNDGWFPSGEVAWNLTDNLVLRAGYAKTQAKNRYQRSVIPSHSINFNAPTSGPFAGIALGTINLRNPDLQPWTADNFEAHLEYYTAQGGVLSVGAFRKEISNNQISTSILLDTPELVAAFDLEPEFLDFQATSWINRGIGQIDGLEAEVRQPLDRFLPEFAKGLIFTGSYNLNNLSKFEYANGNISIDFQNFYETQYKANVGYRRGKLLANIGLVRNGKVYRQRDDAVGHEGHRFYPPYTTVDFSLEYAVHKHAKLFLSGRNITNGLKTRIREIEGAPEWSQLHIENNLGVVYQAGITGSF